MPGTHCYAPPHRWSAADGSGSNAGSRSLGGRRGGDRVTGPDAPLTNLRGARVEVDPRRARRLIVGVLLVALAVVAIVLLVAGLKKNNQESTLRHHGVPVSVTVTSCTGLLGGSGSNLAGYACKGTYTFDGHDYDQSIPGTGLLHSGQVVQGVIVSSDPALLSTPAAVAGQGASDNVFIAPVTLFLAFLIVLVVAVLSYRRGLASGAVEG
jgi:hypothetical protein